MTVDKDCITMCTAFLYIQNTAIHRQEKIHFSLLKLNYNNKNNTC